MLFDKQPAPEPIQDFMFWCRQEYASYEGNSFEDTSSVKSPYKLAEMVYQAWTDYCRDKGLL